MQIEPKRIFEEYQAGVRFKSGLGTRGLYEQARLNERFFNGDQWHGARCGNDRPLVRHNVIKRIGEFKMAQVLSDEVAVHYSAEGVPNTVGGTAEGETDPNFDAAGAAGEREINFIMSAMGNYHQVTAQRVGLSTLCTRVLKDAYITGSGLLYTYWNPDVRTGLYADDHRKTAITGDVCCEVLGIENVVFGDPYAASVADQPYILLAARRPVDQVRAEAMQFGASGHSLREITAEEDNKVLVLTKLYRRALPDGSTHIFATKVTRKAVVRAPFDTRLRRYPLTLFTWEDRNRSLYGESEVTYLIPNQIAINRMITAKVWSAMTTGMPTLVVNGDTVTDTVTNEPGQVLRVYGTNEDVAGALHYVAPPAADIFDGSINNLIENTLTQCGANAAVRGDSDPDNASAITALHNNATLPLRLMRSRYHEMLVDLARIWADFWITQYGDRRIKTESAGIVRYIPFSAERYRDLLISAKIEVRPTAEITDRQTAQLLADLYDRGVLTKQQYLSRLPAGMVPNLTALLQEISAAEGGAADDGV